MCVRWCVTRLLTHVLQKENLKPTVSSSCLLVACSCLRSSASRFVLFGVWMVVVLRLFLCLYLDVLRVRLCCGRCSVYVLMSFCQAVRIDVREVVCDKVSHSCTAKRYLKTNRVLQLLAQLG